MLKSKIITDAISILNKELGEGKELYVEIMIIGFLDTFSGDHLSGEFACIRAEDYFEGFYYNVSNNNYYYYGEAYFENPGSFSNNFGFLIEDENLHLLPEKLKTVLSQVGISKVARKLDTDFKISVGKPKPND